MHTTATLTHNQGGDSLGIVSGMRYLIAKYGVPTDKVFATGLSSGAMMTNVLAGAYPDFIRPVQHLQVYHMGASLEPVCGIAHAPTVRLSKPPSNGETSLGPAILVTQVPVLRCSSGVALRTQLCTLRTSTRRSNSGRTCSVLVRPRRLRLKTGRSRDGQGPTTGRMCKPLSP